MLHGIDATHTGHRDVGDDNVGALAADFLHQAQAIVDLSDEICDIVNKAGEAFGDDRMIISEQHFRTHATLLSEA